MVKMMMGRLAIAAAIALVAASACASAEKSYSFERDGASSVSYTGQTARLNMADELYDGMKSNESTVDMLLQQFNNGTGFADPALDESGKNIAGKVASGCAREKNAAAKEKLEDNIKDFANNVIPTWNTPAADGTPGVLSDSKRTVNVNAKGWAMVQIFQKSLIGAFTLDQIVNNYIEPCKLDDDGRKEENDAGTVMEGKGFTRMEHAWDEAFGYLYGQEEDDTADLSTPSGVGTTLNKYLKKVSSGDVAPGISEEVFDAFVAGRKAIVDKDYKARDAAAKTIKIDLSKVIGAMVVNYLQEWIENKDENPADAVHALSEGYGFIFSLPYTNDGEGKPYFTQDEVDAILTKMDNFWTLQESDAQAVIDQVNERFGFSAAKEKEEVKAEEEAPSSDDG